jgi:hypothetical protein
MTPPPGSADLIAIVTEAKRMVARPGNDFLWSSWDDAGEAPAEIERFIQAIAAGEGVDFAALSTIFAPTGPLQEVAISSGWGEAFNHLAARFDVALNDYRKQNPTTT